MTFFEIVPNRSLTVRSATAFYLLIIVAPLTVAIVFAIAGFWPILTIAGIEVIVLGMALWWTLRKTTTRELIEIDERNVRIRKSGPGHNEEHEFSRYWTQVRLIKPASKLWPNRLLLRSKGRSVEIGTFLTNSERRQLERRLSEVIAAGK